MGNWIYVTFFVCVFSRLNRHTGLTNGSDFPFERLFLNLLLGHKTFVMFIVCIISGLSLFTIGWLIGVAFSVRDYFLIFLLETKDLEKVTQLFLKRWGLLVFLVHLGIAFVVSFLHVTFTQYLSGLYGCRFQITKRNNITAIFRLLFLTISLQFLQCPCAPAVGVDW